MVQDYTTWTLSGAQFCAVSTELYPYVICLHKSMNLSQNSFNL